MSKKHDGEIYDNRKHRREKKFTGKSASLNWLMISEIKWKELKTAEETTKAMLRGAKKNWKLLKLTFSFWGWIKWQKKLFNFIHKNVEVFLTWIMGTKLKTIRVRWNSWGWWLFRWMTWVWGSADNRMSFIENVLLFLWNFLMNRVNSKF